MADVICPSFQGDVRGGRGSLQTTTRISPLREVVRHHLFQLFSWLLEGRRLQVTSTYRIRFGGELWSWRWCHQLSSPSQTCGGGRRRRRGRGSLWGGWQRGRGLGQGRGRGRGRARGGGGGRWGLGLMVALPRFHGNCKQMSMFFLSMPMVEMESWNGCKISSLCSFFSVRYVVLVSN